MSHVRPVSATRVALTACAVLLVSGSGLAQQRALTIEEIYDPEQRVDFGGRTPSGLTWLSDTRYLERSTPTPAPPSRCSTSRNWRRRSPPSLE